MKRIPILLVVAMVCCHSSAPSWPAVRKELVATYPNLRQIEPQELSAWLKDPNRPPPLLLDVRTESEYAVSHIRDARRVDPRADPTTALAGVPKNAPLITYCSVGYRSSAMADRLQRAGFSDVRQLDGSIFRWANEGRPVVRDGRMVNEVHPYNEKWGRLLNEQLHARVASVAD